MNSRRLSIRRRLVKAPRTAMNRYEALTINMFQFGLNPPTPVESLSVDSSTARIIGSDIAENHRDQRFIIKTPIADASAKHA